MFTNFFYLLKAKGLNVSIQEWFTLLEGMKLGLHDSSLTGFYYLARSILVKTEADFDKFDLAFLEYFKEVKTYDELPPEILDWLTSPIDSNLDPEALKHLQSLDLEELRRRFEERLKEQTERHDGGSKWVGTGGTSPFGHSGYHPSGVRVGGESRRRSALQVAGERSYKDFREDHVLEDRQFQMAFRRLRQFSSLDDGPKDELKLDETIHETCENGGNLKLVFGRPRRNSVKLMLLFDSGGSMWRYASLCGSLFEAVSRSNHFKDLKIFYFHNCFYDRLYTSPYCMETESVDSEWVLQNLKGLYKVIVVGDASMSPYELMHVGGSINYYHYNKEPGIVWISRFMQRYEKMIWLNPVEPEDWERGYGSATIKKIKDTVPMYHLSVGGLQAGLKYLAKAR